MSRSAEPDSPNDLKKVPVAWEALEDAFENNAPEVHSYLNTETGDVIRVVDGIADPTIVGRMSSDLNYMRVDPVSSREQYRWMERYIVTVPEGPLHEQLVRAIDGKGAFRRFKDVLMNHPGDRERWFAFRSERLRAAMEAWLEAHGIEAIDREQWAVPDATEAGPSALQPAPAVVAPAVPRIDRATVQRQRIEQLVERLPVRELETAVAFLEFLSERRPTPKTQGRSVVEPPSDEVDGQGTR